MLAAGPLNYKTTIQAKLFIGRGTEEVVLLLLQEVEVCDVCLVYTPDSLECENRTFDILQILSGRGCSGNNNHINLFLHFCSDISEMNRIRCVNKEALDMLEDVFSPFCVLRDRSRP